MTRLNRASVNNCKVGGEQFVTLADVSCGHQHHSSRQPETVFAKQSYFAELQPDNAVSCSFRGKCCTGDVRNRRLYEPDERRFIRLSRVIVVWQILTQVQRKIIGNVEFLVRHIGFVVCNGEKDTE